MLLCFFERLITIGLSQLNVYFFCSFSCIKLDIWTFLFFHFTFGHSFIWRSHGWWLLVDLLIIWWHWKGIRFWSNVVYFDLRQKIVLKVLGQGCSELRLSQCMFIASIRLLFKAFFFDRLPSCLSLWWWRSMVIRVLLLFKVFQIL